eukprot:4187275-Lingulodinium_polyedra.AAC.1
MPDGMHSVADFLIEHCRPEESNDELHMRVNWLRKSVELFRRTGGSSGTYDTMTLVSATFLMTMMSSAVKVKHVLQVAVRTCFPHLFDFYKGSLELTKVPSRSTLYRTR